MKSFAKTIEIELGTTTTKIFKTGAGTVIEGPSVVAVDKTTGRYVAAGDKALEIFRTVPDSIFSIYPIREGVIYDFDAACYMLDFFLQKVGIKPYRYNVMVVVPADISPVEKKATDELFKCMGVRNISTIEKSVGAAVDAGIDIDGAYGVMVVDVGGGTTELAVLTLGEIVAAKSIKVSGNSIDRAIIEYIKAKHNISIGMGIARELKEAIADMGSDVGKSYIAVGRDCLTGLPNKCTVISGDIKNAVMPELDKISNAIRDVLEVTPLELVSDIRKSGIYICGNSAKISGIDAYISQKTGIPCRACINE